MMIIGHRVRTESFEGARTRVLQCQMCGISREHHERRVTHTATAFFVEVVDVKRHTVWQCAGCGRKVAENDTAEWLGRQGDNVVGQLSRVLERGVQRGSELLGELSDELSDALPSDAPIRSKPSRSDSEKHPSGKGSSAPRSASSPDPAPAPEPDDDSPPPLPRPKKRRL